MSTSTVNDNLLGTTIAERYELVERLRATDIQTIYLANDLVEDSIVWVKILVSPQSSDESYLEGFEEQAKEIHQITHPNVAAIIDFGVHQEHPYLVVPRSELRTLKDALSDEGPFPAARVIDLAHQIGDALEAGHQLGILHGGITSDTILLLEGFSGAEQVIVTDFGLGRLLTGSATGGTMTQSGQIIGSPEYMSPEQIRGEDVGLQSDIYSSAIVIYELLCGHVPFPMESQNAEAVMDVLMRQATEPPPSLRSHAVAADLPEEFESVVLQALSKSPAARPASIGAFSKMLDESATVLSFQLPESADDELLRDTAELHKTRQPTQELDEPGRRPTGPLGAGEEAEDEMSFDFEREDTVELNRADAPAPDTMDDTEPVDEDMEETYPSYEDPLPTEQEEHFDFAQTTEPNDPRPARLRATTIITDPNYPKMPDKLEQQSDSLAAESEEPEIELDASPPEVGSDIPDLQLDDLMTEQDDFENPLSALSSGERPSAMFDESTQSFGDLDQDEEQDDFMFPREKQGEEPDELTQMDLSEASEQLMRGPRRGIPKKLLLGVGGVLSALLFGFVYSKMNASKDPMENTPFAQTDSGSMVDPDGETIPETTGEATSPGNGEVASLPGENGQAQIEESPQKVGMVDFRKVLLSSIAGQDLQAQYLERYKEIQTLPDADAQLKRLHSANTRIVGEYLKELRRTVEDYAQVNGYALIVGAQGGLKNAPYVDNSVSNPQALLDSTETVVDLNDVILDEYNRMFADE